VEAWSRQNKGVEIVFTSSRIRYDAPLPLPLPDITQVSWLKILGVTLCSRLSVTEQVQNVFASCAQILHALRLLRAHGMCDTGLQTVYQAIVVAKLLYAAGQYFGIAIWRQQKRQKN